MKKLKHKFKCACVIISIIIDINSIAKLIRIRCYKIEKVLNDVFPADK